MVLVRMIRRSLCDLARRRAGQALATVKCTGAPSVVLSSTRLPAQPGLVVDGVGRLSLPLTDTQEVHTLLGPLLH